MQTVDHVLPFVALGGIYEEDVAASTLLGAMCSSYFHGPTCDSFAFDDLIQSGLEGEIVENAEAKCGCRTCKALGRPFHELSKVVEIGGFHLVVTHRLRLWKCHAGQNGGFQTQRQQQTTNSERRTHVSLALSKVPSHLYPKT